MKTTDFLIIGSGVIGLNVALKLKAKYPSRKVIVLEKEKNLGAHSSGRNSGVIHAGFYYTADSMKARFTREGNERTRDYCKLKNIPVNMCGKLVVTKNEDEENTLDELARRGQANGVKLEVISKIEAQKIEPRVKTVRRAIWSPNTGSVDPTEVLRHLHEDALQSGIEFQFESTYLGILEKNPSSTTVKTNHGPIQAGFVVNTAGLYADRVAMDFGFSKEFRILPFKGLYIYSNEKPGSFRTNIYPVPDLGYPFLGVHFTLTVDGKAKIGPTAIPAFWREQYSLTENFKFNELCEILWRELKLFAHSDFDFRNLAIEEIKKYSRGHMVNLAKALANDIDAADFKKWGKPGIRAQLYNIKTNKLEMDFKFEGDQRSFHVLNAVSPAFTAAIPFADHVTSKIAELV